MLTFCHGANVPLVLPVGVSGCVDSLLPVEELAGGVFVVCAVSVDLDDLVVVSFFAVCFFGFVSVVAAVVGPKVTRSLILSILDWLSPLTFARSSTVW